MHDASHPLVAYWLRFSEAFVDEVRATSPPDLAASWHSGPERTRLYTLGVLPKVAACLGLSLTTELFKVDAAMSVQASNGETVPVIFVESENDARTAVHEMRKLCAVSCPLAVLITVIEWNPEVFGPNARRDRLTSDWSRTIKAHAEIWQRPGIIGVLVGEWGLDDHLRFYRFAYSTDGTICLPEETVLDKLITSSGAAG